VSVLDNRRGKKWKSSQRVTKTRWPYGALHQIGEGKEQKKKKQQRTLPICSNDPNKTRFAGGAFPDQNPLSLIASQRKLLKSVEKVGVESP